MALCFEYGNSDGLGICGVVESHEPLHTDQTTLNSSPSKLSWLLVVGLFGVSLIDQQWVSGFLKDTIYKHYPR